MTMTSTIELCAPPAVLMLLLSIVGMGVRVPLVHISAMQHLAAGIVLCAVAVELCPIISDSPNDPTTIGAICVGFSAGIALFLALSTFCEVEEPEEEPTPPPAGFSWVDGAADPAPSSSGGLDAALLSKAQTQQARDGSVERRRRSSRDGLVPSTPVQSKLAQALQIRRRNEAAPRVHFPTVFAVAVCVDAFVDGFLIGLAGSCLG